jgi:ATP-dependent DNA ligase
MNSTDLLDRIDQIAATSSTSAKAELVEALLGESELARQVVKAALDPFITFGLTPTKSKTFGSRSFDEISPQPWVMLHQLSKRELTGAAAKTAVKNILEDLEPKSSELLWRILKKDLRAGFSKNTVNRVMPGTIPTFDVMLSKPYEEKRVKVFPVAVEPKLDGMRAMFLVKDGAAKGFTRVGNHIPSLDYLSDLIAEMVRAAAKTAVEKAPGDKLMELYAKMLGARGATAALDAEITTGGHFNEASGEVRRKSADAENAIINLFDALPYNLATSSENEIKIPFKARRKFAEFIAGFAPEGLIVKMTDLRLANSHEEIQAIYEEHRANGLEGAMVKPLDAHYVKSKGFLWMKMKAEETEDLRITGWFEGEAGTKLEGKFGGLLVEREHEGKMVEVKIGGGFKEHEREELEPLLRADSAGVTPVTEKNKVLYRGGAGRQVLGRLAEIEFHEITPDGSLRHPRFVRFRDDKDENLKDAA